MRIGEGLRLAIFESECQRVRDSGSVKEKKRRDKLRT